MVFRNGAENDGVCVGGSLEQEVEGNVSKESRSEAKQV